MSRAERGRAEEDSAEPGEQCHRDRIMTKQTPWLWGKTELKTQQRALTIDRVRQKTESLNLKTGYLKLSCQEIKNERRKQVTGMHGAQKRANVRSHEYQEAEDGFLTS